VLPAWVTQLTGPDWTWHADTAVAPAVGSIHSASLNSQQGRIFSSMVAWKMFNGSALLYQAHQN